MTKHFIVFALAVSFLSFAPRAFAGCEDNLSALQSRVTQLEQRLDVDLGLLESGQQFRLGYRSASDLKNDIARFQRIREDLMTNPTEIIVKNAQNVVNAFEAKLLLHDLPVWQEYNPMDRHFAGAGF